MKKIKSINVLYIICILIFILPVFSHIFSFPIMIWDEAIYANNALEMSISKNFLVLQANGEADLYNTKPPFVIWCQCICIWLFGANEFSIRLPSILAALGTAALLVIFSKKTFNSYRIGLLSIFALFTSYGYVKPHVVLTGDLDAMLVFWISFFSLPLLYYALVSSKKTTQIILISGAGFLLAYMTKSTAALLPIPGIVLVLLLSKKIKYFIIKKQFYLIIISIIFLIASYYFFRESMLSGYWDKVYHSEFKRFTHNIMSWHNHPFNYYFLNFIELKHFLPHLFIFPFCIILGFLNTNNVIKKATLYTFIIALSYLFIISYPDVKLEWYDAPFYPFSSIIIGIGIHSLFNFTLDKWLKSYDDLKKNMIQGIIILLLFSQPYYTIINKNNISTPTFPQDFEGYSIRELTKEKPSMKAYKIFMEYPKQYKRHIDQGNFYIRALNHYQDYNLELIMDKNLLHKGDTVLVCQNEGKTYIENTFNTNLIYENEYCKCIKIVDMK